MTTRYKTPAIVQCSLGDMRHPIILKTGRKPLDLSHVLLRIASHPVAQRRARKPQHSLALDIRDGSDVTLRATLECLSERFQIMGLIPPIGISSQHLYLGHTIAGLSDVMALPGFSKNAFATTMNRYLTRCHWKNMGLPTTAFALVQLPSALDAAISSVGLPARLSPIHYALPRLEAHILHKAETTKTYKFVARALQHHALTHPIHFSFTTDLLAVAAPPGITVGLTMIIRNGIPKVANRPSTSKMAQLAIEGCVALGIKTGFAYCLIQHTDTGDFLDGIIPNYIDENCRVSSIAIG